MATKAKINPKHSAKENSFFEHSRDLLADVWDHWIAGLNYSPETAQKKMTAQITKFHKAEVKAVKAKVKSVKAKVKKVAKSATRKVAKKVGAKKRSAK